jgi:hypothetical protein
VKTKRHFFVILATWLSAGLSLLASPSLANTITGNGFPVVVDASFDVGTGPEGPVSRVAVQPDGRVLVAGEFTTVTGVQRRSMQSKETLTPALSLSKNE